MTGDPTLLLLHGFLGSRRDWEPFIAALGGGFRPSPADLPGHGAAGDPGDAGLWSVEGCADALAHLLRDLSPGRAVAAGYSLGGRVALQLAARHPDALSAAIVVSGSPGLATAQERAARRERDETLARRLEGRSLDEFLDAWYRSPLFDALRAHPRFPDVLARRRENDPRLLARSLRTMGLGAQSSLWERLPGLETPLLFVAGERDPKFARIAREAAALSPAAAARVIPGAGHALLEEAPEAVAAAVREFLASR